MLIEKKKKKERKENSKVSLPTSNLWEYCSGKQTVSSCTKMKS